MTTPLLPSRLRSSHVFTLLALSLSCVQPTDEVTSKHSALNAGATLTVNASTQFQTMVGFGVNGQPRNWGTNGAAVKPALDLLVNDLNATVWRVEINMGLSDWEQTNDNADPATFNWAYYDNLFANDQQFKNLWGYLRYLNSLGITNIELAAHGQAPNWMQDNSGNNVVPASKYDEFVETMVAVLEYSLVRIPDPKPQFRWFSPFNEVDFGGNAEGIGLTPSTSAALLNKLVARLNAEKVSFPALGNLKLIAPELANESEVSSYRSSISADSTITPWMAAFSFHSYPPGADDWSSSAIPVWLTETNGFVPGTLSDNCGSMTWSHATSLFNGTLNSLQNNMPLVMVWTEYDASHSHSDDHWETFGLLKTGFPTVPNPCAVFTGSGAIPNNTQLDSATYTPSPTYQAFKHIAKYVKAGAKRVDADSTDGSLNAVAFVNPDNSVVIVGQNGGTAGSLQIKLQNLPVSLPSMSLFSSTSTTSFVAGPSVTLSSGVGAATIPANSLFTLFGGGNSPTVSVVAPVAGQNFSPAPASIALQASASAVSGRSISSVSYFFGGSNPVPGCGGLTLAPYACTWSGVATGTYGLTAVATDNTGVTGTSSVVSISVGTPPPTATITSPANGASFSSLAPIVINASATAGSVGLARVEFLRGGVLIPGCSPTASPFTCTFTPPSVGTYAFTAVAYDNASQSTASTVVTVTVTSAPTVLVGNSTNSGLSADNDSAGSAEAFQYTATASGTVNTLTVYLDTGTSSPIVIGLYLDSGATPAAPGDLRTSGTISNPVVGLNSVTVPSTTVTAGLKYWLAVLSPLGGGSVHILDKTSGNLSQSSASSSLSSLPQTWSPGTQWSSSAMLAYASSTTAAGPDTTPPTVALTAPAAGSTVSGSVTVSATASDNVGVTSVQFKLDGANLGTVDTTVPYSVPWATTSATAGAHTLSAVATDAAGNSATSAAITVTVNNSDTTAPTVALTAPAAGSTVSGSITVSATASDNVGVVSVQFKLDGANLGTADTTSPYSVPWATTSATAGAHTLSAVATDAAGNSTTSAVITVTVNNSDTTAPTVALTAPAAGSTVSGSITVSATASDNVGVVSVQFKLDGANLGTADTTSPYSVPWATTSATAGAHTLSAVATDAAGNSATSAAITVTVNNSDTTLPTVALTAPAAGSTVSGSVTVSANANDNVSVASVQFKLDGANLGAADTTAPYSVPWATTAATPGAHTLSAVATDTSGNSATSAAITVTVNNSAPTVLFGYNGTSGSDDESPAGTMDAYRYTNTVTGSLTRLNVFVSGSNQATRLIVGVYSDDSMTQRPATRLGSCTITVVTPGVWNSCTLAAAVPVTAPTPLWISVLSPSGNSQTLSDDFTTGINCWSNASNLPDLPPAFGAASCGTGTSLLYGSP